MDDSQQADGAPAPGGTESDAMSHLSDASVTLLYDHIRDIARRFLSEGFYSDSLAATDLAHEALAKILGDMRDHPFESERHVLNMAARAMHRLLIDRLRRRSLRAAALEEIGRRTADLNVQATREADWAVTFADQVEALERRRPRSAEVVRYRFFFSMTLEEVAKQTDCSVATVHRELAYARAFLTRSGI